MRLRIAILASIATIAPWSCRRSTFTPATPDQNPPSVPVEPELPDEEKIEDESSTSYLIGSAAELPKCNAARSGQLAYVKDEKQFYNCSGTEWATVEIQGTAGSAQSVYDANDMRIGSLSFLNWPRVGVEFSDGARAAFNINTGKFVAGLCADGFCEGRGSNGEPRPYCYFDNSSCSGTCYVIGQPIRGTVVPTPGGVWVQADGTETATSISILSSWRHDFSDCVGSGPSHVSGPATYYPIQNQYNDFPTGVTYPFTGPLTVK